MITLWTCITGLLMAAAYRWAWRVGYDWGYVEGFNESHYEEE